jgi:hypothetical protein
VEDPRLLGDEGESHWQQVRVRSPASGGVLTHFQTRNPSPGASDSKEETRSAAANAALYHGFGANLWSWQEVQQPLANFFRGTVVAHDQAGFGLTWRPDDADEYQPVYNGQLGRQLLSDVLAQRTDADKPVAGDCRPWSGLPASSIATHLNGAHCSGYATRNAHVTHRVCTNAADHWPGMAEWQFNTLVAWQRQAVVGGEHQCLYGSHAVVHVPHAVVQHAQLPYHG